MTEAIGETDCEKAGRKMELISVIIPIYNAEKFLKQCLDSVCEQTYSRLEIVLVDDGSTDRSYDICRTYADADCRIKLIHTENGGEAAARKAGLKASLGTVITFVDSDDWIEPDTIEKLYTEMEMQQTDIVVTAYIESQGENEKIIQNKLAAGRYEGEQLVRDIFSAMLCCRDYFELGLWPYLWNKMFRREMIEPCIMTLNEKLVVGVDAVCTFPAFLNARAVSIMQEAFYHYRIHPNSIMHRFRSEREETDNIKIQYQEMKQIFEKSEHRDILLPQLERYILHHFMVRAALFLEKKLRVYHMSFIDEMYCGSKVILYGAGAFGTSLYYTYEQIVDYSIVGWCDGMYEKIQKMGYPVISPEEALEKEFDYIIIAVLNEETKNQIERSLIMKGIEEEKIRWINTKALEKIDLEQICR